MESDNIPIRLPGDCDSFTGEPGDCISASAGLTPKQLDGKALFASLDLREQDLSPGALHVLRRVRDLQLAECEKKAAYYTIMLQKLLPRMGDLTVNALLELLKNEQLANQPISAFCDFFHGLQRKLTGLGTARFTRLTEFVKRARLLDYRNFLSVIRAVAFADPTAHYEQDSLHKFLSQLLFDGGLPSFSVDEIRAKIPGTPCSEIECQLGQMTFDELFSVEEHFGGNADKVSRLAVLMLLRVRDDSPRELYRLLFEFYSPFQIAPPLELLLFGVLGSYIREAGNILHTVLLGLSLLIRYRPESLAASPLEEAVVSTVEHVKSLLKLGSLLAVKCSLQLLSLSRTASLCSETFRDAESLEPPVSDCSKMWSFASSKEPWLPDTFKARIFTRPVMITRQFNLLSYGLQPPGLVDSDIWMTLRWSGLHSMSGLGREDWNPVLKARLDRRNAGVEDPLLDLALHPGKASSREHVEIENALESPEALPAPPVAEPDVAAKEDPVADENFITLDDMDGDWADWATESKDAL